MIQKSILLHCPPQKAFELFTSSISDWWPPTHRPSKDPQSQLFLEATGRFCEHARDGREIDLGRVVAWDPPHRLKLDFYIGTSPSTPTAVEITFTPEDAGTRVTVQHGAKLGSEELWTLRASAFDKSWHAVLQAFLTSVTGVLPSSR